MIKRAEQHPTYLYNVAAGLVGDFDLTVAALSGGDGCLVVLMSLNRWIPHGEASAGRLWRRFFSEIASFMQSAVA